MRWYFIQKNSLIAISVFLSIHLTSFVWSFDCPLIKPDGCDCDERVNFVFKCSKNNSEYIRFNSTLNSEGFLDIKCGNISSGEILTLLNFNILIQMNVGYIQFLGLTSCPLSVVTLFKGPVLSHTNQSDLEIITKVNSTEFPENIFENQIKLGFLSIEKLEFLMTLPGNIFKDLNSLKYLELKRNNLTTLPKDIFKSQTNLIYLSLEENNLTNLNEDIFDGIYNLTVLNLHKNSLRTLPENIFKSQINLRMLRLDENKLTSLYENVFRSLINLEFLVIESNRLTSLPEKIFQGQTALEVLYLADNSLITLPKNIFENQTNLFYLDLNKNNLTTLPEHIFNHRIPFISLEDNPWACDSIFLEIVRFHGTNNSDMICADGELMRGNQQPKLIE